MITTEQYRALLKSMGLRQIDVAWMMGAKVAQCSRWATGVTPVPQAAVLLLLALRAQKISPTWLRHHIPKPVPYNWKEL